MGVYDLTIQDNPNFALSCGIFVHNSKDAADSLAGALLDALKYRDEYLFYNPVGFDYEGINAEIDDQKSLIDDLTQNLLQNTSGRVYVNSSPNVMDDGIFNSDVPREVLGREIQLPPDDDILSW